ncbi:MAG: hypothetical protein U0835_26895 [Isosphaeraceae bacterium]
MLEREIESEEPIVAALAATGRGWPSPGDRSPAWKNSGRPDVRSSRCAPALGQVLAVSLHPAGGEDSRPLFAVSYLAHQAFPSPGTGPGAGRPPRRVVEVGLASTPDVATILMPLPALGLYAFNDAAGRLLVLDPGAKEPRVIPDGPVSTPTVSPDGREVWA